MIYLTQGLGAAQALANICSWTNFISYIYLVESSFLLIGVAQISVFLFGGLQLELTW